MGLFNFKKKREFLDLTERYKKQQEKIAEIQQDSSEPQSSSQNAFSFLGNLASGSNTEEQSSEYIDVSQNPDEKRKKLAKRLVDMTSKMEDLSNQIYHLQQRLEVLEKKSEMRSF